MLINVPNPLDLGKGVYPASRLTGNGDQFRVLTEDLTVTVLNGKYTIIVKAGFQTNGGSLPPETWSVLHISPWSMLSTERAFIVHDALYSTNLVPRIIADLILVDLLRQGGLDKFRIKLIYDAVKFFGSSAYADCADKKYWTQFVVLKVNEV